MLSNGGSNVQKTCTHFGKINLMDEKMESVGAYTSLYGADLHAAFQPHYTVRQEELSDELLLNQSVKVLGKHLGSGSFGTAFKCQFRGDEYVIKLPNSMLECGLLYFDKSGFLKRLPMNNPVYVKEMEKNNFSFDEECENNEMALDPASHRELRDNEVGSHIKLASHEQYMKMKAEMDCMKRHKGYNHIHKILGFFPGIPAIFSEPCCGSLQSMILKKDNNIFMGGFERKLSFQWLEMVRQIGSAIEYLHDVPCMAHLDIKPGNILYIETLDDNGNSVFNWKLSDFGWCQVCDKGGLGYQTMNLRGTPKFLPRILKDKLKNHGMICYDAYECSLHCFMTTIIMSIKFDIPSKEGYLFARSKHFNDPTKKDFDVVDCVKEFPIIYDMFEVFAEFAVGEGGKDGEMFNSERDHPLEMLSRMFFSPLWEKPDHFANLMRVVRLELEVRQKLFEKLNEKGKVWPLVKNSSSDVAASILFSDSVPFLPSSRPIDGSSSSGREKVASYQRFPEEVSASPPTASLSYEYRPMEGSSSSGREKVASYQRFSEEVSPPIHIKRRLSELERDAGAHLKHNRKSYNDST